MRREELIDGLRTARVQEDLIHRMADALRPLSTGMLGSGTARSGRYQSARLVNFRDRERVDPHRLNAHAEGMCHNPLDHVATHRERMRRVKWPLYGATEW